MSKYYSEDIKFKALKILQERAGDGTGPEGKGPRTGRGLGNCKIEEADDDVPEIKNKSKDMQIINALSPALKKEAYSVAEGKMDLSEDLYAALFYTDFIEGMPYGTMKARSGDPMEWITYKLQKLLANVENTEDVVDDDEGIGGGESGEGGQTEEADEEEEVEADDENIEEGDDEDEKDAEDEVEKPMNEVVGVAALGAVGLKIWQNRNKLLPLIDKFQQKGKRLEALGDLKNIIITKDIDAAANAYQRYLKDQFGIDKDVEFVKTFLVKAAVSTIEKKIKAMETKGEEPQSETPKK